LKNRQLLVAGEIVANSEAFENLTTLCDRFGSRFFATPEEKAAADFIADKFREYRLQTIQVEPSSLFGWKDQQITKLWNWKRGRASLRILESRAQKMPCVSWANAPSTPDAGVTAEIYNLESGTRAYILEHQDEIRDKIVLDGSYVLPGAYLTDPLVLRSQTLYGYLVQFGAAGVLFSNSNYGDLPVTGSARYGSIGEIPACGISRETSLALLRQMKRGPLRASLHVKNEYKQGATTYNVVADLVGNTLPEEVILVGGHYDSHDIAVGAMDNAVGTCIILEAARALAKHGKPVKRTIRFCCFGGEELGLNGSTGYVLDHQDLKDV
jgi:hypothetical protein